MLFRFRFILTILFGCASFVLIHAQSATVKGHVSDSAGNAVEGAAVGYIGATSVVYTDSKGNYSLSIPSNVNVLVVVRQVGAMESRKQVNAKPGEVVQADFSLEAKPILPVTDIRDNRIFEPGIPIPPEKFEYRPGPSQDITSILRFVGATSNNELSTQYSVRGGNFDENLVYINGIEIYRPILTRSGQQEGLTFPNPDMTENIYFSAGGFEAKYGDKMSSVLDVRYRRPHKFRGSFSASLLGVSASVENESEDTRFYWMLGIRQKSNRYLLNAIDTRGDYTSSYTDFQALLGYDVTDQWNLEYIGGMSMNKYNLVPSTRETDFGTLNNALRFTVYFEGQVVNAFQTQFHSLSLNYRTQRNWIHKWTGSVFNSYETETFDVLGQYYIDQLEADLGKPTFGQVAFNRGVGSFLNHARNYLNAWIVNGEYKATYISDDERHIFNFGTKFQYEQIQDELSEWNYVDSAGYSIPFYPLNSFDLQDVVKARGQLFSNRYSAYAQYRFSDTLRDSSVLVLTVGTRGQYWDLNGQTLISPRAQMKWRPHWKNRNVIFTLSGGMYYQPPFYRELRNYNGVMNRNVKAQTSAQVVLGTDITFRAWERDFRFIGEVFYKYLDNLNPYEVDDVRIRYFGANLAYGYSYGLDMRLYGQVVQDAESWISVSLLRTRENLYNDYYNIYLNSDGDTIIPGYTLNNIAVDSITHYPGMIPRPSDQLLTVGLYFQDYLPMLPDCKMSMGLILGTGMPFGPPNHQRYQQIFRMPPYRRIDIGFSYLFFGEGKKSKTKTTREGKIIKSLWAGMEVFNLIQVNNTISYYWVKDVTGRSYAVPNYLTNRQLSLRLIAHF
jgi:hypothetical protein